MMNRIATELVNRGYDADVINVTKNGVERVGISIGKGENIRPTIYQENSWENKNVDDICDSIEDIYKNHAMSSIDADRLSDPEFIKANAKICIQKKGNESLAKRDYLDLETYIRVVLPEVTQDGGFGSYKLNEKFDSEDIFEAAKQNTINDFRIESLAEIMSRMLGVDATDLPDNGIYVIQNIHNCHAASALCFPELFQTFCKVKEIDKCIIIPSSIHEVMVLPYTDDMSDRIDDVIQMVNAETVSLEEQLSDHAYYYTLATNEITY